MGLFLVNVPATAIRGGNMSRDIKQLCIVSIRSDRRAFSIRVSGSKSSKSAKWHGTE